MRCRDRLLVIALALLSPAAAYAQSTGLGAGTPDMAMVYPRGGATSPGLDFIFSANAATALWYENGVSACVSAATCMTTTRATTNGLATDLLPASPSGQAITTFADNTARISTTLGGLLVEEARVNQLLNATAPVTQTTASISCAGPLGCTLWVNGSGSATASAGTATGCSGFAAVTNGVPNNFICTGAGTITVTVSGSLNAFQLEIGSFGSSLCTSGATACSRGGDVITVTTAPTFGSGYTFLGIGATNYINNASVIGTIYKSGDATNNRLQVFRDNGTSLPRFANISGGVNTSVSSAGTWAISTSGKVAVATAPQAGAFNGGNTWSGAGALPSGVNAIDIGSVLNVSQFNGTITRVSVWPTVALTSAQLQAITK